MTGPVEVAPREAVGCHEPELAVADDLAAGRLIRIEIPELDLKRALRAIWNGSASPPAGPARDLVTHILSLRRRSGPPPRPVPRPRSTRS